MITPLLLIFIIIVTLFAIWKDFKVNKSVFRGFLLLISGLFLIGFVLEPKWWSNSEHTYVLITEGIDDSGFNEKEYTEVYSLKQTDKTSKDRSWLASPSFLKDRISENSLVDVVGFGTSEKLPSTLNWRNRLAKPPKGMVLTKAPTQIEVGREFEIQISVLGFSAMDTLLVFKDGSEFLNVSLGANSQLSFTDRLDVEGPIMYEFEWLTEDTLIYESWNLRGIQPEALRIGVLGYSPSFEINYLIEHLGERGHQVIQRNRIGKDRFRYDAINASTSKAESILDQLSMIDVLLLDAREFNQLNGSEKQRIEEAINTGLDVVLNTPSENALDIWEEAFVTLSGEEIKLEQLNRLEERNWFPEGAKEERVRESIPLLNLDVKEWEEKVEVLNDYAANIPLSIRAKKENGSITGHLFYKTYGWLLSGNEEVYNRFWTSYLSRAITLESSQLSFTPTIPKKNHRIDIFVTETGNDSELTVKSIQEKVAQKLLLVNGQYHPGVSSATFWPKEEGWHMLTNGETQKWMYVYSAQEWKFDEWMQIYNHTVNELSNSGNGKSSSSDSQKSSVPAWIWLITFLSCQVILWVERKI